MNIYSKVGYVAKSNKISQQLYLTKNYVASYIASSIHPGGTTWSNNNFSFHFCQFW